MRHGRGGQRRAHPLHRRQQDRQRAQQEPQLAHAAVGVQDLGQDAVGLVVADLRAVAPSEAALAKVRLLREFDPASSGDLDVPDPYYGGPDGFEEVLDLVEAACRGLLDEVR